MRTVTLIIASYINGKWESQSFTSQVQSESDAHVLSSLDPFQHPQWFQQG